MASLAEQIQLLANPEPISLDPEGDEFSSTRATVVSGGKEDKDGSDVVELSALRKGTAPLLEDEDSKYGGRRVSRAELAEMRGDFQSDDEDDGMEDSEDGISEGSLHSDLDGKIDDSIADKDDYLKGGMNGDHDSDSVDDADDKSDDDGDDDSIDDKDGLSDDNQGGVQKFSVTKMEDELEKGKAVKMQLNLWDSFLEYRIRVQKALVVANKLPQCMDIADFVSTDDKNLNEAQKQGRKSIFQLLHKLLVLQENLLEKNPETKSLLYPSMASKSTASRESDEEIPSDSDEEGKQNESPTEEEHTVQTTESLKLPVKRKADMTIQQYGECISKRHAAFQSYRDSTISKWGEKTRLASGKLSNKGFSSFDRSALAQIKQIMSDKPRLIKRTQLKRNSYRVLGKIDKETSKETDQVGDAADAHLKDYDPQVFDDDDFYHQLLRELIERKTSSNTDDPIEMGRQWLELQKLRRKIKKKVDTKASKGRKIRYNVHSKLVSYMAPVERGTMPNSSRNELFSSLFGQRQAVPTDVQVVR